MARRKGRPRGLAPARKEGPDRKSLVKYVDIEASENPRGPFGNAHPGATLGMHVVASPGSCGALEGGYECKCT